MQSWARLGDKSMFAVKDAKLYAIINRDAVIWVIVTIDHQLPRFG
jgi:hypothetical protein